MKTTRRTVLAAAAGIAATIAIGGTETAHANPYGGRFVAHFVYASASTTSNEAKFRAMRADAIESSGLHRQLSLLRFKQKSAAKATHRFSNTQGK